MSLNTDTPSSKSLATGLKKREHHHLVVLEVARRGFEKKEMGLRLDNALDSYAHVFAIIYAQIFKQYSYPRHNSICAKPFCLQHLPGRND